MIINMNGNGKNTTDAVLQSKTFTPEYLPVVVGPDTGYDGLSQVTINPDANLKSDNIRLGKTVLGVTGTFEGMNVATPYWDPNLLKDMPGNYNFSNPACSLPAMTCVTESIPYTSCSISDYQRYLFSYSNVLFKSCHEQDPRFLTLYSNEGSSVGMHIVKTIEAGTYTFNLTVPDNMVNANYLEKLKIENGTIIFGNSVGSPYAAAPTIKMNGKYEFNLTPKSQSQASIEVDIPETVLNAYSPITPDYEVGKEETTNIRMELRMRKAIFC